METLFSQKQIVTATFSMPKATSEWKKITIKAISQKEPFYYQLSIQKGTQEFHENLSPIDLYKRIESHLPHFRQAHLYTKDELHHYLWSKKGKETHLRKKIPSKLPIASHNRNKNYLISTDTPIPFLIALGIQNKDGSIKSDKRDKFVQINKFLEILLPHLKDCKQIVDFGCGKAYLTFALAHLLPHVSIVGVDLKQELLNQLTDLAKELNQPNITFEKGDIADYKPTKIPDAVISLHACNTATDVALYKAVKWGVELIVAVPCCHQELYSQVSSNELNPLLRHGILKERFAALATDAARAELLTQMGYKTDVIEFIDHGHTPKNILIRAVKTDRPSQLTMTYKQFCQSLNIHPHLERLLFSEEAR